MTKKLRHIDKHGSDKELKMFFVPISKNECSDPYLINEIQKAAAQIVLLGKKRGRPVKDLEEIQNAA